MKPTVLVWLLLALGFAVGIAAQIAFCDPQLGQIQGTVYSAESNRPLTGATINLEPAGLARSTGSDGRFVFDNLKPGNYRLSFTCLGYTSEERPNVRVTASAVVQLTVLLNSAPDKVRDLKQSASAPTTHADGISRAAGNYKPSAEAQRQDNESKTGNRAAQPYLQLQKDSYSQDQYKGGYLATPVPPLKYETPSLPPFDMFYRDYGTNGFVSTGRDRLSTFGADISDASYTLARRYLNEGNMPPTDAIRVEEFINHFNYDYAPPDEGKFRIFSELAASPFSSNTTYLKIGVKGREIADNRRKPIVLTAVIDVSGSMGWDNRFDVLKQSMRLLIDRLDSRDRIALISYQSYATEVLSPTGGDDKSSILNALYSLRPGGSTNAEAGLKLAYQVANEQFVHGANNLVILLSDGVANVGRTSPDAIMGQIKGYANKGITMSTFGYGMGNLNDALLEQLARMGNGSYAYIDNYEEAQKLFADQLVNTVQTLARDVKIQVEFNPGVVASYRLLGYEKRAIPDQNFRDNKQDGGEIKAGHEVTAIYELVLSNRSEDNHLATITVRWKNLAQDEVTEVSQEVDLRGAVRQFDNSRPEFRLAVAASRFAETLKQTRYADGCFDRILAVARRISYDRPNDETRELVSLVERAQSLTTGYGDYQDDDSDR